MTQNDNGTYTNVPIDPSGYGAANIPTGGSTPPPGGDPSQTYQTPNGPKTIAQMQDGLRGAGYNGPMDDASVIAAYNSTAAGGSSSASSGNPTQNLLDAIASGDEQRFDEAVREFNQNFGENQRQFNENQYSNLATHLLDTATQLDRPKDYFQLNKYTSGGQDLFQQLFGNQPRPDFSAPTGTIEPETIADLMAKLGFTTVPGSTPPPASTAQAAQAATSTPAAAPAVTPQVAAQAVTTGDHPAVAPPAPTTPLSGLANTLAPPAPTPVASTTTPIDPTVLANQGPAIISQPSVQPSVGGTLQPAAQTTQATTTTPAATDPTKAAPVPAGQGWPTVNNPQVPLPYQINPAVWDSMGPVGQGLTESLAKSAGWDWDEFMRQLNASRPQGTAPASSTTQFKSQVGAFS